ncbi:MAG: roadblock/LC7 domain-containing protein [Nitrososphaeria archaeon]|nr:roadblock/LC7 domain-containing protein [Nitrososphaeria archaeon]
MATAYESLNVLVESIMVSSKGWVEAVAIVSQDGTPLSYNANVDFNPDYIAATTAAIAGATSAVVDLLNSKGFDKIDVQLKDKRHLLIKNYKEYYIICITKPNPNLGFVNLILEAFLSGKS